MSSLPASTAIKDALAAMGEGEGLGSFPEKATTLLATLGYRSQRIVPGQTGHVKDFIQMFPLTIPGTKEEESFKREVRSAHILFQFSEEEIGEYEGEGFDPADWDPDNIKSFLFVAVELGQDTYTRGRYAAFARQMNKRLGAPAIVLFVTASVPCAITLAFIHRRANRRDPSRDVLGRVSLIREINTTNPHRAHLHILAKLSLNQRLVWMDKNNKPHNFDGLLESCLDALDTRELNKEFYKGLYEWFDRALKIAKFPTNQAKMIPDEEHVIRLITRLLFVWFIKEKNLVAEDLFIESQVAQLLKDYHRDRGDSYYRAVLQNLFFATLNTEIGQRSFSRGDNRNHRDFSRYRYRNEMGDPDSLLKLFAKTPFINGGLFDCLDSFAATGDGGYRIDCFSDNLNHRSLLSFPNRLFFNEDPKEPGIINLFNRYKFTVEENTPTEAEVALDPELLGKIFENLLAAIIPETKQTARKKTGSYYTPRPVVDYMVEEALVRSLAIETTPEDGNSSSWVKRLHYLLDYEDALSDGQELFSQAEGEAIIEAVAKLKILDPAVGSGAFPMAILHKLTLVLRRLDPGNSIWEKLQKQAARERASKAFDTDDQTIRDAELEEISATFERYRNSDFGRKLYLIQNSIYCVDIQPIATQIAKLRFFISLTIEQQTNYKASKNYGIKPLPNLETRFVAADTLLGLERPDQLSFGQDGIMGELQGKLNDNRENHFHAGNRQQKLHFRKQDAQLRKDLATALQEAHFPATAAEEIAQWDPYDQNTTARWFDPEYMFGVTGGFDVVIGNPPYSQLQKNNGELGKRYGSSSYITFIRTGDIYQLFYERGCQLLRMQHGILIYITSNSWLKAEYGKKTRRYFAENHRPLMLLELGKDIFEEATVDSSVLMLQQGGVSKLFPAVDTDLLETADFPPAAHLWKTVHPEGQAPWSILSPVERSIMNKMQHRGTPLKDWQVRINRGITTGYNKAFIIDNATKESLVAKDPKSAEIIKPVLRGRDMQRFHVNSVGCWLIDIHNGYIDVPAIDINNYPAIKSHLDKFYFSLKKRQDQGNTLYNLRSCAYHQEFTKEKLFWMDMTDQGRFAYSDAEIFCNNKGFIMTGGSLKYLCTVLNSTTITWIVRHLAVTTGVGLPQYNKFVVESIPIPKLSLAQEIPFVKLVDRIIEAKAGNPRANTRADEAEIDRLVYALYGLTDGEIRVVEGKTAARA